MPVTLTLALPDLRPDTIRAAFDALLPPPEPVAPVEAKPSPPAEIGEPPAEPAPSANHRAAMLALSRGLESFQVCFGVLRLESDDWLRLAMGMDARVSYGTWSVEIDGIRVETWRSPMVPNGTYRVTAPEPAPEPTETYTPPASAPDDAPPTPDDVPF